MTAKEMIQRYTEKAFAHEYIFGFFYKGLVYMTITNETMLPSVMKKDRASRGQGYSLRFSPNREQKKMLLENARAICSKELFEQIKKESRYNKGEIFEKIVTEFFGQEWQKDNVPFTKDGDITIKNIAYQIKFERATFTNEKALARL